jgi:ribosomal protein L37AE/L43A
VQDALFLALYQLDVLKGDDAKVCFVDRAKRSDHAQPEAIGEAAYGHTHIAIDGGHATEETALAEVRAKECYQSVVVATFSTIIHDGDKQRVNDLLDTPWCVGDDVKAIVLVPVDAPDCKTCRHKVHQIPSEVWHGTRCDREFHAITDVMLKYRLGEVVIVRLTYIDKYSTEVRHSRIPFCRRNVNEEFDHPALIGSLGP